MVSRRGPGSFPQAKMYNWDAWCEILHILRQLNAEPCPAWTTERGKLKRGWSPGDSLNLVRVLSVRINYSQQCRNDINGRWEYSKSIMGKLLWQCTTTSVDKSTGLTHARLVSLTSPCCSGWPAPILLKANNASWAVMGALTSMLD